MVAPATGAASEVEQARALPIGPVVHEGAVVIELRTRDTGSDEPQFTLRVHEDGLYECSGDHGVPASTGYVSATWLARFLRDAELDGFFSYDETLIPATGVPTDRELTLRAEGRSHTVRFTSVWLRGPTDFELSGAECGVLVRRCVCQGLAARLLDLLAR
ncbi:MAG: hypothetical protein HZA52_01420 [Planctomycetes bacterium]|nr:hypothetical protein [Planctomycetota bacterium]